MKLLGIEFHGFKSFADSSDIRFHDGMTAIVGPNGCGKSNISDALRWVLGEQRPSAIRGSRMEEAIFQGTKRRKPIQRAEVTLHLSNTEGVLPVPYSEVKISRTLHRGGEGEYRLNGTLCRLRDIQDLCRDTGLGTNAYAIIESRMIDAILSERAEERRAMFEEAAGIGRYKERRRVAMRRLDEADADLARVDDLIGEVQKKVRSLAQQRGRARRYFELRDRKLALELALAQADLERLGRRQSQVEAELEQIGEAQVDRSVEQRTGEAEYERVRTQLADLERERSECGRRLMATRDRLAERERARLVAEERRRQAVARLEQIEVERDELRVRRDEIVAEIERARRELGEKKTALESVRENLRARETELAEAANRRESLEVRAERAEAEERAYREQRADLQARREGARAEVQELQRRRAEAEVALSSTREALDEATAARDRAREAAAAARERLDSLDLQLAADRERHAQLRSRREELRAMAAATKERLSALEARIEALAPLATGEAALGPAVQAALARADELGIRGVVGQSLEVEASYAQGLEAYLGPYLEGLIVDDAAAVQHVRRWFLKEYEGPGGLVVLRRDGVPEDVDSTPPGVRTEGPAAAWVRYLLREARFESVSPTNGATGPWIGARESLDALGVLRLGQPYERAGILERRAELDELQERRRELERESRELTRELEEAKRVVSEAEEQAGDRETERRTAEQELAHLRARSEAADERVSRLEREAGYLEEVIERLETEARRARDRSEAADAELGDLQPVERSEFPGSEELARVRDEWERCRELVAELRLAEARAAAALERTEREVQAEERSLEHLDERKERLSREVEDLEARVQEAEGELEAAASDLESLFEERERLERQNGEMEARSQDLQARAAELETRVRQAQKREREASERKHELELERSELRAEIRRARERLEDEWGRPFDDLVQQVEPAEGESADLAGELSEVAEKVVRLEPVNMLAEQEYQEESERLEFLQGQRADLAKARDDLRNTIRRINDTASKELLETLEKIRENFRRTFLTLFQGGECDVWLEDPDDPLDSAIEISASPSGKRTQRIHLLSGGERALTALALLFAIYLVKPSPFCVLDEVDAPLDETNIRRFVAMLEGFKSDVQFIVITHNPVTIEAADWIYGVTMEEPGVSKIVGVEFSEYERGAVA